MPQTPASTLASLTGKWTVDFRISGYSLTPEANALCTATSRVETTSTCVVERLGRETAFSYECLRREKDGVPTRRWQANFRIETEGQGSQVAFFGRGLLVCNRDAVALRFDVPECVQNDFIPLFEGLVGQDVPVLSFSTTILLLSPTIWLMLVNCRLDVDSNDLPHMVVEVWHTTRGSQPLPALVKSLESEIEDARSRLSHAESSFHESMRSAHDFAANLTQAIADDTEGLKRIRSAKSDVDALSSDAEEVEDRIGELLVAEVAMQYSVSHGNPVDADLARPEWLSLISEAEFLFGHASDACDSAEEVAERHAAEMVRGAFEDYWVDHGVATGRHLLRINRGKNNADFSKLGDRAGYLAHLQVDTRKILETSFQLFEMFIEDESLSESDCGPAIASMAKSCERMFSDWLEAHRPSILENQGLSMLREAKSFKSYTLAAIDGKELRGEEIKAFNDVLQILRTGLSRGTPFKWSGPKMCGFALRMLDGHIHFLREAERVELTVFGPPQAMLSSNSELPSHLSEFQAARNGFVHHDFASVEDLKRNFPLFLKCVSGLLDACYRYRFAPVCLSPSPPAP